MICFDTAVGTLYSRSNTMSTSSLVAIVTGGNSGMGMGIVRKLVEKGWKVAIVDINDNKEFAKELGDAASYHKCNVADYDRLVKTMEVAFRKLTVNLVKQRRSNRSGTSMDALMRCVRMLVSSIKGEVVKLIPVTHLDEELAQYTYSSTATRRSECIF